MGASRGEPSVSERRACPPPCSDLGEAALKIVGVTTEDDGIYTCIAVNDMGSASSSASLRVLGKLHPKPHPHSLWPEVHDKSLGGCKEQTSLWGSWARDREAGKPQSKGLCLRPLSTWFPGVRLQWEQEVLCS